MPAIQAFCNLFGINNQSLSREVGLILEAELFVRICEELENIFREQLKNYSRMLKLTIEMENAMLDSNFISLIIRDILMTEEYTLEGIACYTGVHEDVVHEVVTGKNTSPSATLLRRVIELHRSVRRDLYQQIARKLASEYMSVPIT